jgi:quercetin dioxygenase-like cupin family protein
MSPVAFWRKGDKNSRVWCHAGPQRRRSGESTLAHATAGFARESVVVTERKYAVVSLDELDAFPAMAGAPVLMPLRQRLDVRAFGINCWTAPVGAPVIERHSEPGGDEEVYIVVRGRVRFTIGEETFEPGPATVVYVPPDTTREAVAVEPETLVVAIGGKPGEPFEPKSWEDFQIAFAQAHARGDEEARALLAEELARDPNAWQPAYNAACFEALIENADAAFGHLARAFALGPERVRKLAANGEDFATLRSDPRWQQLMDL